MKKLFCVLLILSLIFCPTALAANGTYSESDRTATTTLTTTINGQNAPTYTIIIPSTLSIAPNATSTELAVKLQEVASASAISVETNLSGSMTNGSDGTIDFTVSPNRLTAIPHRKVGAILPEVI